ncbi:MAG: hypothetical protein IBX61_03870 [Thermoleophilia bacterium]|nr:hypothetical protein [Thermoleophilia bacterium]
MTPDSTSGAVADLVRLGQQHSQDRLRARTFNVHGVTTLLLTNSDTMAGAVSKLLRPFRVEDSSKTDITVHLFAVDDLVEDMAPVPAEASLLYDWGMLKIFHAGQERYLKVDDRARVVADIGQKTAVGFAGQELLFSDWLISNLFFYPLWAQLVKESGLFPLHAAGLSRDDKGFLFLGKSGSGKSTLTLNLVRGGYGLLSDDTVFLRLQQEEDRVRVLSFPEEINVKEETIQLLPELSKVKNFSFNELRGKSSFSIDELYPGCVVESSIPRVLVFPEIADSDATVVEPMSRTEALALSMRYGFFFLDPSTTARHFEILSRLAGQAHCYRLYAGRNQEELERVIGSLLNRSGKAIGEEKE